MNIYREKLDKALVTNAEANGGYNTDARKTLVFFPKEHQTPNSYNLLQSVVMMDYQDILKDATLTQIAEIQFAVYNKGDFFKKHRDTINVNINGREHARLITMSINLSDPAEYEGGELEVYHNGKTVTLDKDPGSYIIFPAVLTHQANEVTNGTRQAIVTWVHERAKIVEKINREILANENR